MQMLTFDEWRSHWGDERLKKRQAGMRAAGERRWAERNDCLVIFPCWELTPGFYWKEDWSEITARWNRVGGRCFEGTRVIAAKWDAVWSRFAARFPNGYGKPHPPYAPDSCASWRQVDPDEAVVLGVITEAELRANTRDPEFAASVNAALDKMSPAERVELFKELGMNKTRAERHAERKQRDEESRAEAARVYSEHARERAAIDDVFVRMRKMDEIFGSGQTDRKESPAVLMRQLQELIHTSVFDRYPHWRARAIRYAGVLLEERGQLDAALGYYASALEWDPGQPLKRRIAALKKQIKT